jgi:nicotinamide phosphoribosyltransferase
MIKNNIIFTLDSYKQLHDVMYWDGTEFVYSYLEARTGSEYEYSVFFGLQYFLKEWLEGVRVTKQMVDEAEPCFKEHFKYSGDVWSRAKWDYIIEQHGGKLPLSIKAVPEGTKVSIGNILMSIVNTDPKCFWLTNALETLLQHVWYQTAVCSRSHRVVNFIREAFKTSVDDDQQWLADYYLHDFGGRAVSCPEQAGLGGMSHLVNSKGTDTDMSIPFAVNYYDAKIEGLCYSVPASEHSIATSLGKDREFDVTRRLIQKFPKGILSVVSDSYDIENAVNVYCSELSEDITNRDGKFVIRPDSPRFLGDTAANQVLWIANKLAKTFGFTKNSKGYKVLHPKVGIIYGDGLSESDIIEAVNALLAAGYAASTCVYGQGGGLLQKLNRDNPFRMAFKSSAQCRDGVWYDIFKEPKDVSKASKRGQLKLVKKAEGFRTVQIQESGKDEMVEVFNNGVITKTWTFDEVRERAKA